MQNSCFRVSCLVVSMACECWAFAPWLPSSSTIINRNILSARCPAWSFSGPRSSIRHDSLSRSIRATLDDKSEDVNTKPPISVGEHAFHHKAINDAYEMICHGSVPSHTKSAASGKVTQIASDNSAKRDVLGNASNANATANGAVLKVAAISNRFESCFQ